MNLIRQMVGQGLDTHKILLETFCLRGGGCENRRLPGWWEWPGGRLEWGVQSHHRLYADKRTAKGSSPALQPDSLLLVCVAMVWGSRLLPTPQKRGARVCPVSWLCHLLWLYPHPSELCLIPFALVLSCFVRTILLIASIRENRPGRK